MDKIFKNKKITILRFGFLILITGIIIYLFFRKSYIIYEEYHDYPMAVIDYRPMAYEFIHNNDDVKSFISYFNHTSPVQSKFFSGFKWDFENHSYLIVYGAPVKRMWFSYKSNLFDDPSPYYASARRWRCKFVQLEYNNPDNLMHFYVLDKNLRLKGVSGS